MNPEPKKTVYPRPAFLVRVSARENYSDSMTVKPCLVLGLEDAETAQVLIRVGARNEKVFVPVSTLASTQRIALGKMTLALHALASRPPQINAAGMTEASDGQFKIL